MLTLETLSKQGAAAIGDESDGILGFIGLQIAVGN